MISVKEAVQKAAEYFADLYPDKFPNVLVEEIESKGNDWLITMGFDDVPDIFSQLPKRPVRRFKLFTIDALTGEVKSMRIREVERVE